MLAILGTGVQARSHARAFSGIRDWDEIRVAGRDRAKARGAGRRDRRNARPRSRRRCAAPTSSRRRRTAAEPVVLLDWVAPGTHVGSVGFAAPGFELDPALVRAATIVVESRDSSFAPSPAGAPELAGIEPESVAELGEIVAGTQARPHEPGRDYAVQVGRRRRAGPRRSGTRAQPRPGSGESDSRSSWRRFTHEHERVQPRPRRRHRLRDRDRRARPRGRLSCATAASTSRSSSGTFRSSRCGGCSSTSRSSRACRRRTASSRFAPAATCPTSRRCSRSSAAAGSSGS